MAGRSVGLLVRLSAVVTSRVKVRLVRPDVGCRARPDWSRSHRSLAGHSSGMDWAGRGRRSLVLGDQHGVVVARMAPDVPVGGGAEPDVVDVLGEVPVSAQQARKCGR